jgi:autotransporter translocation and assembly factor TamB
MRKGWLAGLTAGLVLLGLVAARRHEAVRFVIEQAAGLAGYGVRIADQRIGTRGMGFYGIRVTRAGEPLLDAREITVRYDLRDLLPGSTHRFGLRSIAVDGAKLTVVRFPDGSYNIALPQPPPGPPQPQPVDRVPIALRLSLHNVQLELREPKAFDPSAKRILIRDFNAEASIDTARVTRYRAGGAFVGRHIEPFTIDGVIDAQRSYAMHHAYAKRFPLRALANYFADTPDVRILAGRARDFDARLYSLAVEPNVAPTYHVGLNLDVAGGVMALHSLDLPVRDISGRLKLVDGAFFLNRVRATLAGVPLRITGGIYDLTGGLTGSAQLRLGISADGDLSRLRDAFSFTRDQPLRGGIDLGVLVEGPIDDPLIVASGFAADAAYGTLPLRALSTDVLYHDGHVALAPIRARYAGMHVALSGVLTTAQHLQSDLTLHATGSAQQLPYLDEMLGSEPMVIDAAARGTDSLFHVAGVLASQRGISRAAGLLQLDRNGTARIDPFWLHTGRGDFDGGYVLDRPRGGSGFWALARHLRMRAPRYPAFPGLNLPEMPKVDARSVDIAAAGGGSGRGVVLAGTFSGERAQIAGVRFDRLAALFSGGLDNAAVNRLSASGPWGRFEGDGAFSTQAFVAHGSYRGSFEGLQPFLGSAIPGHGRLAGVAAIAVEPGGIVVQGSHLHMRGASLHGIPIDSAEITLGVEADRLRVYAATAHAAGGRVVAAGTFALSGAAREPSALSLVAAGLNAAQLRGIGLPLDAGRLWASGDLAAGTPIPRFEGGVSVARARIGNVSISGGGDVRIHGDSARLRHVLAELGGTAGNLDGSIGALSTGAPSYDLHASVAAGSIASMLRTLGMPAYSTGGTFDADVTIGGSGLAPEVSGRVGVPVGEINGLPFTRGAALIAAGSNGIAVRAGSVQVGTTHARFSAVSQPQETAIDLRSAHADLGDFNNFFDTGDTLAGTGSLKLAIASSRGRLTSSGVVDVRALRYRNLPIGDVRGYWTSARNAVRGSLAVGGAYGLLRARGSIAFQPAGSLQATFSNSRYDLSAQLRNLDLSLWIPALGFTGVPITGTASGDMSLRGRFPLLDLRGAAKIQDGTIGPLTLESASIAVHSQNRRIYVDGARMRTPGLSATAGGSLGFTPHAPLALQIHAQTDDLPRLVHELTRATIPVRGSFESTLQIGGTFAAPTFTAGVDATDVEAYGIPIASLFGEIRLRGRSLELSNAGASFARGVATLAGSLPFQLAPLRIGPPNEPMSFDLDLLDVDPAIFDGVFGNDTKLGGTINGHLGLSGSVRAPVIVGRATLANGSYVSAFERTPVVDAVAQLAFNHTSASLEGVRARAGSGTLEGSGRIAFPHGFSGSQGIALVAKLLARNAQFDFPAYGSGSLDADLTLTKTPDSAALLAGSATLSNASLPFSAFLNAAKGSSAVAGAPLPLAFDLQASAGKNVRIRGSGYGAGLDIGVTGSAHLSGTLSAPALAGAFVSTGGTLTYFDRAFRVQEASVQFDPSDGVLPTLHAVGTTSVVNPDPDRARNPYGTADITITVDGPIAGLKIGVSSQPAGYSRDQILALLAPFGGLIGGGIGYAPQSALQVQQPSGVSPLGALQPIPNLSQQLRSGITVGQEAFNLLNAQFAASLLNPVETALGQGLGLSSVNVTVGYYGSVGVRATRVLGKAASAVYATTFGVPQLQSFGLQLEPYPYTSALLSFFYQTGPQRLLQFPGAPLGSGQQYLLGQPLTGNSGFSLNFQHAFW